MAFLDPGERLIIMDINRYAYWSGEHDYALTVDELKRLRDLGVATVLQQLWWDAIEPERGVRDWRPVEISLARARRAGMKVLLGCYQRPPRCLPEEWYLRTEDGGNVWHLSLWNEEANEYEEGFVRDLAARFGGDGVLLQNTLICDGETMLVLDPSWHDPAGLASFRAWAGQGAEPSARVAHRSGWLRQSIIDKMTQYQGLLLEVQDHGEIWFQLHPMIDKLPAGTQYVPELFEAMRQTWPEASICWLLYTFYEFSEEFQRAQIEVARRGNVKLVVGAGHCHGLEDSVPRAAETGLSLLCGPRHDHIMPEQKEIEPWMWERLGWAVQELGDQEEGDQEEDDRRSTVQEAVVKPPERAVGRGQVRDRTGGGRAGEG